MLTLCNIAECRGTTPTKETERQLLKERERKSKRSRGKRKEGKERKEGYANIV